MEARDQNQYSDNDVQAANKRRSAMDSIVGDLTSKLTQQQSKRTEVEERWLADLRQYHSRYDPTFYSKLQAQSQTTGSSTIFVNQTRPKCNMAESRVGDMLFPVDGRNWAADLPSNHWQGAEETPQGQQALDDAQERAKGMQAELDDQLADSDYTRKGRDAIHDAVVYGTGILRGPVTLDSTNKSWREIDAGVYELDIVQDNRPGVLSVNVWDFFPDMSAKSMHDCEFVFERDFLSRLEFQKLLKHPGYRDTRQQVKDALTAGPESTYMGSDRRQEVRAISGVTSEAGRSRFERWRYHGPIQSSLLTESGLEIDEDDDRDEIPVYCEFVGQYLIKYDLLPLDTEEYPYSTFVWFQADETPFGFGIPWAMRSSQSAINSAWRAMLDNAALSAGPQIVIDENAIEPDDNNQWALSPRKVWRKLQSSVSKSVRDVFAVFDIPSFQPELMEIYREAKQLADEETNLPLIAQGQAPQVAQTATQTSMQMNSANAVLRRIVKNWDDDVTKPLITRFYDWNMQYNPDPAIKVDMVIKPRGTSTLLVKETQSAAILGMINTCQSPALSSISKFPDMLRTAWETLHINPDDYVKTDDEIKADQIAAQQQPPQLDPEKEAERMAEARQSEQDNQVKLLTARMNNQTKVLLEMMQLAQAGEIAQDEFDAKYAEMALRLETGAGI